MSSGALTLAVTSSTGVIGAAVGTVETSAGHGIEPSIVGLAEIEVATERQHAEELVPRLIDLLDEIGCAMKDVERFVVDVGPGRFTGLRVGLTTIRALAFALDRPVLGCTSLEILAASVPFECMPSDGLVTSVIDARRSEVFQQSFVGDRASSAAVVGPPEELAVAAAGLVVGDGVDRYADTYSAFSHRVGQHPSAVAMLRLSADRTAVRGTEVTPRYLREPDAVPNVITRRDQASTAS